MGNKFSKVSKSVRSLYSPRWILARNLKALSKIPICVVWRCKSSFPCHWWSRRFDWYSLYNCQNWIHPMLSGKGHRNGPWPTTIFPYKRRLVEWLNSCMEKMEWTPFGLNGKTLIPWRWQSRSWKTDSSSTQVTRTLVMMIKIFHTLKSLRWRTVVRTPQSNRCSIRKPRRSGILYFSRITSCLKKERPWDNGYMQIL